MRIAILYDLVVEGKVEASVDWKNDIQKDDACEVRLHASVRSSYLLVRSCDTYLDQIKSLFLFGLIHDFCLFGTIQRSSFLCLLDYRILFFFRSHSFLLTLDGHFLIVAGL